MSKDLSAEEREQCTRIIDAILKEADLSTIGAKKIRKGLAKRVDWDISDQLTAIEELILERFDMANNAAEQSSEDEPLANGKGESESEVEKPKKKKVKKEKVDSDAVLAAKLQAQEDGRARPTRGAGKAVKRKVPKKSKSKVKVDDDSDVDGEGEKKVRKGGFHKEFYMSQALMDVTGETQLSRPQVVKKIWDHIKANNLQVPEDKRQIRCDEKLQAVFKQDKVSMFTMNKHLSGHLWPVEAKAEE